MQNLPFQAADTQKGRPSRPAAVYKIRPPWRFDGPYTKDTGVREHFVNMINMLSIVPKIKAVGGVGEQQQPLSREWRWHSGVRPNAFTPPGAGI